MSEEGLDSHVRMMALMIFSTVKQKINGANNQIFNPEFALGASGWVLTLFREFHGGWVNSCSIAEEKACKYCLIWHSLSRRVQNFDRLGVFSSCISFT